VGEMSHSCHVFLSFSLSLSLSLSRDCISRGFRLCTSLWVMDEVFFFLIIGDRCVSGRQKWIGVKNGRSCYLFFFFNLGA